MISPMLRVPSEYLPEVRYSCRVTKFQYEKRRILYETVRLISLMGLLNSPRQEF